MGILSISSNSASHSSLVAPSTAVSFCRSVGLVIHLFSESSLRSKFGFIYVRLGYGSFQYLYLTVTYQIRSTKSVNPIPRAFLHCLNFVKIFR